MRWVWAIRLMLLVAIPVAILENEGRIHTLSGTIGRIVLVLLLAVHLLVVMRLARRGRDL